MKSLLLIITTLSCLHLMASSDLIRLTSDKSVYTSTENPILRATLNSRPDNTDFQFDIIATLNGANIPTERVTDYMMFSKASSLASGDYTWAVTVVLQDARYARDLKATIKYYENRISDINQQLLTETDPQIITQLNNQKNQFQGIITASQSELNQIRTQVSDPVQLQFSVQ